MEPEALRKNVRGMDFGSIPASLTCEAKLVICATTRHGAVTGDTSSRLSRGTVSAQWAAASTAARSASSSPVVTAVVVILAAPVGVWSPQASLVRRGFWADAEESLAGGRSPLGQPRGGELRPAVLQGGVEHVAVTEVLDHEAVGIAPVVEDLAALDVAADAP